MGGLSKLSRNIRTEAKKRKAAAQPARTEANRKRKLAKHIRQFPTDLQAQAALTKEVK